MKPKWEVLSKVHLRVKETQCASRWLGANVVEFDDFTTSCLFHNNGDRVFTEYEVITD